eukprot:TRINITY_DN23847_c0_g1_i1.p1 TRINITY_DN23847_c0_g1~~TRINITY_DN23847_c0_g1_i1.p1  ORF type:complete len:804 (+),score=167.84 TRINITY_DN23847_c0_g1_i1:83-2413(+)
MTAFSAAIRRAPGGMFCKTAKSQAMTALPMQTSVLNMATYFQPWPKHRSEFIMYGSRRPFASSSPEPPKQTSLEGDATQHDAFGLGSLYGGGGGSSVGPHGAQGGMDAKAAAVAAKPLGLAGLRRRLEKGQKLSMVTAYDFPSARLARQAGVELVLVGDSIGNCRLGLADTVGVTMEDMLRATTAVKRGVDAQVTASTASPKPLLVGDMPFGTYLIPEDGIRNAASLRIAGADMVKLEGGRHLAPLVKSLTMAGIPVMSHIGLEPQKALLQGGLRMQGTTAKSAVELIEDAKELIAAGAIALVVECVPEEVGFAVQASIPGVPVIGIGAGGHVAGQVLVCDDMLGLHGSPPSFAKMFADVGKASAIAYATYIKEVRSGEFPARKHSRQMKPEELEKLRELLPAEVLPSSCAPKETVTAAAFSSSPPVDVNGMSFAAPRAGSFEFMPCGRFLQLPKSSNTSAAAVRWISQASPAALNGSHGISYSSLSPSLEQLASIQDLRSWRGAVPFGRKVAFVPTMGNLHEGHLELVDEARKHAEEVLVSIFVNPAQFAAHEDLSSYPRTLQEDLEKLRARGATAVFTPQPESIYPRGSPGGTVVVPVFVEGKSEAAFRPSHFSGVATVCLKLFNLCKPDAVIFGQKDAMQCVVISRMLEDLWLDNISMHVVPTSRESDGLARSSRNSYLKPGMRQKAPAIYSALCRATGAEGATPGSVRTFVRKDLELEGMEVSYVSVADGLEMAEKSDDAELANSVVSIACLLKEDGQTVRLIDNLIVPAKQ